LPDTAANPETDVPGGSRPAGGVCPPGAACLSGAGNPSNEAPLPLGVMLGRLGRWRSAGRVGAIALAFLLVISPGLVAGPRSTPGAEPLPVLSEGSSRTTAGELASRGIGARSWPVWITTALAAGDAGPGSARTGETVPWPEGPEEFTLAAGYRGWAPQLPVALTTPSPALSGGPLAGQARAIYLTAYSAGDPRTFQNLLELVDTTALNAMVINIKPESGRATYPTRVEAFRESRAVSVQIEDLEALLETCRAYGIYTIARLVCFNDSTLPLHNPDLAVKRPDGRLWRDEAGNYWTDPFRPEVWEYNIDLAEEAARLGFDEIQFDYVRFPTDGDVANAIFSRPSGPNSSNRVRAITEFLSYARSRLAPLGVRISADVFGIICSTRVDTALGQVLEEIAPVVDYISPMIYPSHYGPGHFGLEVPDAEPYLTVRGALSDALERLGPGGAAQLRPWLQDFSLYNRYGPEEVLDQIRATHELGIKSWMLWSPSNRYTVAALRAYTVNLEAYLGAVGGE